MGNVAESRPESSRGIYGERFGRCPVDPTLAFTLK
jgi:hypothetical protein